MRKFLVDPDGTKYELPPLTMEEFEVLGWSYDVTWSSWLYLNKYHEADSFNDEFLISAILVLEEGEPSLNFVDPEDEYEDNTLPYFKDGQATRIQGHSIRCQQSPTRSLWSHMKGIILEIKDGKLVQYELYSRRKREAEEAAEREKLSNSLNNQAAYD